MAYKVARRSLCSIALGLPCRNRPAEFARTSLSACGLPTPVVALACIGNVGIQVFLVQAGDFISYGVCKFICLSSFMYNRFHKELRFFFSLLKRKKKQKKKRIRVSLVLYGNASPEGITFFDQQKSPGGANRRLARRNTTRFTLEIGA